MAPPPFVRTRDRLAGSEGGGGTPLLRQQLHVVAHLLRHRWVQLRELLDGQRVRLRLQQRRHRLAAGVGSAGAARWKFATLGGGVEKWGMEWEKIIGNLL